MTQKEFTPALGFKALTPLYDIVIALLTRENLWRGKLLSYIAPADNDRILDVGCGTGTLVTKVKQICGAADVHGIDPDNAVLNLAIGKAAKANVEVIFHQGFLRPDTVAELGTFTKVISSLVFHQTPLNVKRNILESMRALLRENGKLYIADYGQQRTALMRFLFRCTVQVMDGRSDTQHNAEGCLPVLMKETGFIDIKELAIVPTLTGSISIYSAERGDVAG
jgi:ubiquinone/menaquinone biosynthesis C-methylase UbiE